MAKNPSTKSGPFWTKQWIDKMWRFTSENFVNFDTGEVNYEALGREEYEFRKALFYRNFKHSPRAKEAFDETDAVFKALSERGKKGGRPRKDATTPETGRGRSGADSLTPARQLPMPNDKQEVIDFAYAEGLDTSDAYECWYVTVNDRKGMTADGNPVNNWKAYVRQWCKTREHNRRTA